MRTDGKLSSTWEPCACRDPRRVITADSGKPRGGQAATLPSVLLVHNRYQQRGGEDVVFEAESELLEGYGHRVRRLVADNSKIDLSHDPRHQARLAARTIWSRASATAVQRAIQTFRPDVLHVHNTFPLLSPSILEASAREGIPVVQTLHNYRLVCPKATLFRNGRTCEDCVGRTIPWPGVIHACYQESHARSAVVAGMLAFHNVRNTWDRVSLFIALSDFGREVFIRGGLPPERIVVKRNFLEPDPGGRQAMGTDFVFAGRLTPDKGIETLLAAWESVPMDVRLTIIGDGPLRETVQRAAAGRTNIQFRGQQDRVTVLEAMGTARAVIVPSLWFEAAPLTVIEAFGCGAPVIGSALGSLGETIDHGVTGLLFEVGNGRALASAVMRLANDADEAARLGDAARDRYLSVYTGQQSYRQLLAIYRRVIQAGRRRVE